MVIGLFPTMILLSQLLCFLFAILSAMGTCQNSSSLPTSLSKKNNPPLPIETIFKLPSPLPTWPAGGGFASGKIDLGGLEVCQVSSFTKIWATHEGGPDNLGATFFDPSNIPEGFFMLGSYAQPNNKALFGWVLAGKDATGDPSNSTVKQPTDYTLVWSSESKKIAQDGNGFIWLPTPPDGYKAVGHVITNSSAKPSLDKVRCVRSDFTDSSENDAWIWGQDNGISVYSFRPSTRGIQALGVPTGTFLALSPGPVTASLPCLKNVKANLSSTPNPSQIQTIVQSYSPWIYLHPDEEYLPCSVSWFFKNGALLYKRGDESNPVPIDASGSNLPQDGSNDGAYWLDLPSDQAARERVKKGNLTDAGVYLHIKPILGATFTDVAVWVFYPFNGAARARFEMINVSLGKIGEHVGDWEHLTLRVSNFNGELNSVYFSQHSGGVWVSASELEFQGGNKPVAYSALHSHAFSPKAGLVLEGNGGGGVGIRRDTARSETVVDAGVRFLEAAAEALDSVVVEPPWLNYTRGWGPKIDYDIVEESGKVEKMLPGILKKRFRKFIHSLPNEVLGEQGPTGPKMKDSWSGDERT